MHCKYNICLSIKWQIVVLSYVVLNATVSENPIKKRSIYKDFGNHVAMIMFQVWGWLHDHSENQEQLQCEGGGSILQQKLPWGCAEGTLL